MDKSYTKKGGCSKREYVKGNIGVEMEGDR